MSLPLHLIPLASIAAPAEGLQVAFSGHAAFGQGHNVVDFKQQVGFYRKGCAASAAGIIIALFDVFTQRTGHQGTLTGNAFGKFDFIGKISHKAVKVVNVHYNIIVSAGISGRAGVLKNVFGIADRA